MFEDYLFLCFFLVEIDGNCYVLIVLIAFVFMVFLSYNFSGFRLFFKKKNLMQSICLKMSISEESDADESELLERGEV